MKNREEVVFAALRSFEKLLSKMEFPPEQIVGALEAASGVSEGTLSDSNRFLAEAKSIAAPQDAMIH